MSDSSAADRESLLAEAAQAVTAEDLADLHVGDLLCYLRAYYRHVPVEDLAAAGPGPVAAAALEQARLAVRRPQGRALVRVRPPARRARSSRAAGWLTSSPTTCRSWSTR